MQGSHRTAKAKSKDVSIGGVVIAFIVLFFVIKGMMSSSDDPADSPAGTATAQAQPSAQEKAIEQAKADAKCASDLQCWGERFKVDAIVACRPAIEAKAAHDVKWTDGFMVPMFTQLAWVDDRHTVIEYLGDKVEFQNGFGAMTPMTYVCTYDTTAKSLVSAEVTEGRLQ